AGHSIIDIRKLMKKARDLEWNRLYVEEIMQVSSSQAEMIISELYVNGYIDKSKKHKGVQCWVTTLKGNQLALATAAKPIRRETADKLISDFTKRIHDVNSSVTYLYSVKKAWIFGSYLS